MSLRVWLPLTKDLRQQGLDSTTVTQNSGTTISSGGKLGSCLTATSNATVVVNLPSLATMLANGTSYSLACWVKITNNVTNGWVIKLGTNSCGLWWAASTARWVWNENDGGKRCANSTISSDTANWHHLVTTITKSSNGSTTTARHYVDGKPATSYETQTWDGSGNTQPAGTTITISPYAASLNDIRLYDHCLSEAEIKKLAQGLILHYPLNRQGWGQENLYHYSKDFSNWTFNSGATTTTDNGETVITYPNTADVWPGAMAKKTILYSKVRNKTITVSADLKADSGVSCGFDPCLILTSSESSLTRLKYKDHTINFTGTGKWIYWSATYNITDSLFSAGTGSPDYDNCYFSITFYRRNTPTGSFKLKNPKVELGSIATPWCPNSSDEIATTLGLNNEVEYDISGFGNNGTRVGSFSWSSDTPKYNVSTVFNASHPDYIKIPYTNYAVQGAKEMTWSIWAYDDDWSTYSGRIYSCTEGGGVNIEDGGSTLNWAVNMYTAADYSTYAYQGYCSISKASLSSGWHMFTWVYTTTGTKVYVDGVLKSTIDINSYGIHFANTALYLGAEAQGETTSTGYYLTGKLSDFRIYATALSANDIKSLYQNCATIGPDGTIYGKIRN